MNWEKIVLSIDDRKRRDLAGYMSHLSGRPVYIYGAGSFGRELFGVLAHHGVRASGFIDRDAGSIACAPAPVEYPQNFPAKSEVSLILGIVMNRADRLALTRRLAGMGFTHIIDGQEIRAHYVYALTDEGEKSPRDYYMSHVDEIRAAGALFEDEESHITYEKNLAAHILRDYSDCAQTDWIYQYFAEDIPFRRGFSRFVDCGAYVGDTLAELVRLRGGAEAAVAFEPDPNSFSRLVETFGRELSGKIGRALLLPLGAAGKTGLRRFTAAGGSGKVTDGGETTVMTAAIDDVLQGFAPTYIKMDIEGAEHEALIGAEGTIRRWRPDLAVSVYHIIDDYWRIPLLINSWGLGYRFYLRTHSSCTMETVLYAVPSEG